MADVIQSLPKGTINQLQKKILFTLGFLALYRVGVHIPIPGVDTEALGSFFRGQGGNLLGMFNMFSGGALERFSIFALRFSRWSTRDTRAPPLGGGVPSDALDYVDLVSRT